ncbi:Na+/H+ antiporter subunit E [Marinicrinis sediminis]|uniref:Na+/H+ antiporter subunit E n=1 Tax=Marinicrinis sediminis TaxID=1652465 RepID=A0ABW5R6R0_9BACL
MTLQIVLNLMIAVVWMFLNNDWSFISFVSGYVIGLIFLFGLRRFIPDDFYMFRLWAMFKLLLLFLKELVLSNFVVIGHIIKPKINIRPGIFALHTELKSDWEITILACLITLTPGTLTLEVSRSQKVLYIHAMDIKDADKLREQIKGTFEKAIMEVSR